MNYKTSQRALGLEDDHIVNELEMFTKEPKKVKRNVRKVECA